MKNLSILFVFFLLVIGISSCGKEEGGDPLDIYRELAYNALTSDEKARVLGEWKDAAVNAWTDGNYLVVFQTIDPSLGIIQVVVDPELGRVVEVLGRS
ncbi:hypothetical protein [Algoriphagus sanaruensis]|uniref:PepSY domain-containing protein n=1 Tax=Algoriphagus sanaruensis TaxID=1727163 RepID=A0A142EPE7_9BACT|nr:hypothetical protein [Algoriphagus sanaruensis]AMQ57002.1 hypothetical protein AO498_11205 [Algoriphagus sanaruensis]